MRFAAVALSALLVVTLVVSSSAQQNDPQAPKTPAWIFKEVSTRFFRAANGIWNAKTVEDKNWLTEEVAAACVGLSALAEKYPTDPVAFDALSETVKTASYLERNTAYARSDANALQKRALAQLLRDHIKREDLGSVCKWVHGGFNAECETFLRRVTKDSPHRKVRGEAGLYLAKFLYQRAQRLHLLASRPDRAHRYDLMFGKRFMDSLKRRKPAEVAAEYEAAFELAGREFGDIKWWEEPTIADQVALHLNEIRRMAVGKTALEILGVDQEDIPFKLSDYRGKVVLLYFWQHL